MVCTERGVVDDRAQSGQMGRIGRRVSPNRRIIAVNRTSEIEGEIAGRSDCLSEQGRWAGIRLEYAHDGRVISKSDPADRRNLWRRGGVICHGHRDLSCCTVFIHETAQCFGRICGDWMAPSAIEAAGVIQSPKRFLHSYFGKFNAMTRMNAAIAED